jgi:hypothetical protein
MGWWRVGACVCGTRYEKGGWRVDGVEERKEREVVGLGLGQPRGRGWGGSGRVQWRVIGPTACTCANPRTPTLSV